MQTQKGRIASVIWLESAKRALVPLVRSLVQLETPRFEDSFGISTILPTLLGILWFI